LLFEQPNPSFNKFIPQKPQNQPILVSPQTQFYPQQYQVNQNLGFNGLSLGNYQNNLTLNPSFNQVP